MKGISARLCEKTGHMQLTLHYTADPRKRDAHWISSMRRLLRPHKWDQEFEIRWDAVGGRPVFPLWDDEVHIFHDHSASHCKVRVLDHGRENPCGCLWIYVWNEDHRHRLNDYHAYRQYYEAGRPIGENARAIAALSTGEHYLKSLCDPSMNANLANAKHSIREEYQRWGLRPLTPADNSEDVSIERINNALLAQMARWCIANDKLHHKMASLGYTWDHVLFWSDQRALTVSPACHDLVNEIKRARYKEWADPAVPLREERAKTPDHLLDDLRYFFNYYPEYRHPPRPAPQPGSFGERALAQLRRHRPAEDGLFSRSI